MSAYVLGRPGAAEFLDRVVDLIQLIDRRLPTRGQALCHPGRGLHGWQASLGGHCRELAAKLNGEEVATILVHRDLGRE